MHHNRTPNTPRNLTLETALYGTSTTALIKLDNGLKYPSAVTLAFASTVVTAGSTKSVPKQSDLGHPLRSFMKSTESWKRTEKRFRIFRKGRWIEQSNILATWIFDKCRTTSVLQQKMVGVKGFLNKCR